MNRLFRGRRTLISALGATLAVGTMVALPAGATNRTYVALGDSYTAGPLVPPLAAGSPLDCLRSAHNYPHLTAAARSWTLIDRSCSGATTADMTMPQYPDQPAQFKALLRSPSVVSIGIGGNDNQLFISSVAACSATDVLDLANVGAPCRTVFGDYFVNQANGDGPVVGQALATIHALAPDAQVFVVGYPDILPQQGNCYPQLPLTTGDVAYLNHLEQVLNAMLARQAAAHGATFVDTYTASIGHDSCQAEATRWVEPLVPGSLAAPIHPNARGEAATARALEAALAAAHL